MQFPRRALLAALIGAAAPAALACSSCGCTLSSDWLVQGGQYSGFHADFRFDYFTQDDLRSGTGRVDRGSIDLPADQEVQQETINRNYNLFLDYAAPGSDWGFSAQIPWFDRYHTTIAEGDTEISTSHTKSIGDVRMLARYRGLSDDKSIGVQFGLKLPTGSIHNNFISGPQEGEPLDRGLQPGTGTTDLLVGAYTFGAVSRDWDWFGEAVLQQPLDSREDFKPGTGLNLTVGARYMSFENVRPQLQVNVRTEGRESGANADVANSGATLVYLSPGVNVNLGKSASLYGYVQVPIYQHVNGLQIEPRWSASIGVHFAL
ncbi:MAG TPA: hypothetical protein VH301_02385 [Usitatibacter sp.]|jgi:hypothetical protein|nr:hypothetical protein [Usitatibacter sp.]